MWIHRFYNQIHVHLKTFQEISNLFKSSATVGSPLAVAGKTGRGTCGAGAGEDKSCLLGQGPSSFLHLPSGAPSMSLSTSEHFLSSV